MKNVDLGYIAGLVDGEGSLMLVHQKWHSKRGIIYTHREMINVTNNDGKLIKWLRHTIGFGSIRLKASTRIWVWEVTALKANRFLHIIRPFLHSKVDQADLLLEVHRIRSPFLFYPSIDQQVLSLYCNRLRELHYQYNPDAKRLVKCTVPYIPPKPRRMNNAEIVQKVITIPIDSIVFPSR